MNSSVKSQSLRKIWYNCILRFYKIKMLKVTEKDIGKRKIKEVSSY
jgi:hypothetical protein